MLMLFGMASKYRASKYLPSSYLSSLIILASFAYHPSIFLTRSEGGIPVGTISVGRLIAQAVEHTHRYMMAWKAWLRLCSKSHDHLLQHAYDP